MNSKVRQQKLRRLVNLITESNKGDDVYRISPEEYRDLLIYSGYHPSVTKIKQFGGKPLYITGDLNLSRTPVESLGNVVYINGDLDVSNTKITQLPDNLVVNGYTRYYNTPMREVELVEKENEIIDKNKKAYLNGDWEPGRSSFANKINALYEYLKEENLISELDEDEIEELTELKNRFDRIKKEYGNSKENSDEKRELNDKLQEINTRLKELKKRENTIYSVISVSDDKFYGLTSFEILPLREGENYPIYSIGTEDEMDDAMSEHLDSLIDEVGILDAFNHNFLEDYVDERSLEESISETLREDIMENPESYFDYDDFELTYEQEERKNILEEYIDKTEYYIRSLEERLKTLEGDEYNILKQKIDDARQKLDEAQDEFDSIEPDTSNPTEEMIDDKIESYVEDALSGPLNYMIHNGYNVEDYIHLDDLKRGVVGTDGYGIMGVNGNVGEIEYENDYYFIIRAY